MSSSARYFRNLDKAASPTRVSEDHFGVNYVAGINSIAASSNFRDILSELASSSIRYPGGTVTEKYFIPGSRLWQELVVAGKHSTTAPDGKTVEGPAAFFAAAEQLDLDVQFVLPTASLVSTQAGKVVVDRKAVQQVVELVEKLLAGDYGNADIKHFEIGNEYYYFAGLTPREYAAVADALIPAVDAAIQKAIAKGQIAGDQPIPEIAVQAGAGWLQGDNDKIINGLSNKTLDKVDSVIFHYYPDTLGQVDQRGRNLDQIDAWKEATGNSKLTTFVSEWNVHGGQNADHGMAQASAMISAFGALIDKGVDTASIWGAQFKFLRSGLTSNLGPDALSEVDTRLTPAGEIVASMRESLVGLKSIDAKPGHIIDKLTAPSGAVSIGKNLEVNTFGNQDQAVIYISSRSDKAQDVSLDLEAYFGSMSHVWAEVMTVMDDPVSTWDDENDPLMFGGVPQFDILNAGALDDRDTVKLDPYAIVRVSVQLSDDGVTMRDDNPLIAFNDDFNDRLVGSKSADRLIAQIGDDVVLGRGGADRISLGQGHDRAFGGRGQDVVFGGNGDDRIKGGGNDDKLYAGKGGDRVFGGGGQDVLVGGDGDDRLAGGRGSDLIWAGAGRSVVTGGDGADFFAITPGSDVLITDFNPEEGDKISFLGAFDTLETLQDSATITRKSASDQRDLVLTTQDGHRTVIEGAGADLSSFLDSVTGIRSGATLATDVKKMTSDELFVQLGVLRPGDIERAIIGTNGKDVLRGGDGADRLRGRDGDDRLIGGAGKDKLFGAGGDDRLVGGKGQDQQKGGRGEDLLFGKGGRDVLVGGSGRDDLIGGKGRDTLLGGAGHDILKGGGAGDRLRGGAGDDIINGGRGDDRLTGGAGEDVFVFKRKSGDDVVTDFISGNDQIRISGASDLDDLRTTRDGYDTVISFGNASIRLEDVERLQAADFDLG